MSAVESLVVGVSIALVAWLVQYGVGWTLRKNAVCGAVLSDIRYQVRLLNSNLQFIDDLVRKLKVGEKVPYSALFEPSKQTLFNSLLSEIIVHAPRRFARISQTYLAIEQCEQLLFGILRDLSIWKQGDHVLDEEDLPYIKAKRDRIASYISVFGKKNIEKMDDLPSNYQTILGADVVTNTILPALPEA